MKIFDIINPVLSIISLNRGKRESDVQRILTMYGECRKILDTLYLNGDTTSSVGIKCLELTYNRIFLANLTTRVDKRKKLTEQVTVPYVPTLMEVKEEFNKITSISCPNLSSYLASVVSILKALDKAKITRKDRNDCAIFIKMQTTKYEQLWLYYYFVIGGKDSNLLLDYNIIADIINNDKFPIKGYKHKQI